VCKQPVHYRVCRYGPVQVKAFFLWCSAVCQGVGKDLAVMCNNASVESSIPDPVGTPMFLDLLDPDP
jgi:hypothetical protein